MQVQGIPVENIAIVQIFPSYCLLLKNQIEPVKATKEDVEQVTKFWNQRVKENVRRFANSVPKKAGESSQGSSLLRVRSDNKKGRTLRKSRYASGR